MSRSMLQGHLSKLILAILPSFSLLTACHTQPLTEAAQPPSLINMMGGYRIIPQQPKNKEEFVRMVADQGRKLGEDDLAYLNRFSKAKPNGEWTPGPMKDPVKNLQSHFEKHQSDFLNNPPKTAQEYLSRAIAFQRTAPTGRVGLYFDMKYSTGDFSNVARWNEGTEEFSAMRINGAIATYFPKTGVTLPRFIRLPDDLIK